MADNVHLAQGFGRGMTAIGAIMIVCSFWNFAGAIAIQAGVKRHNKCIILVVGLDVEGLGFVCRSVGLFDFLVRSVLYTCNRLLIKCLVKRYSDT